MADLIIREYLRSDYPALSSIYLQSRTKTFYWLETSVYAPEDFDSDTNGEKILVATLDGQACGFVSIWMPDNFIHHLYVHPHWVNKGIGKALLNAAMALFDAPLKLKCLEKNVNALAFYTSQGWVVKKEGQDEDGIYLELYSK